MLRNGRDAERLEQIQAGYAWHFTRYQADQLPMDRQLYGEGSRRKCHRPHWVMAGSSAHSFHGIFDATAEASARYICFSPPSENYTCEARVAYVGTARSFLPFHINYYGTSCRARVGIAKISTKEHCALFFQAVSCCLNSRLWRWEMSVRCEIVTPMILYSGVSCYDSN